MLGRFRRGRLGRSRPLSPLQPRDSDHGSSGPDQRPGGGSDRGQDPTHVRGLSRGPTPERRQGARALPARSGGFGSGWDHTERPTAPPPSAPSSNNLRARLLSLFADPRVQWVTIESAARTLAAPKPDVETVVAALVQAGELIERGDTSRRFRVPHAEKQRLESMFREAALELGEQNMLVPIEDDEDALALYDEDPEEPRLPVTAGLLSLFLPGTGQLLNGDVGRASLVFAVWSLAWITHLSPVWTFVCLYAGAEAFFTAKIRSMERKMAKDALPPGSSPAGALPPPKPHSS